MVKTLSDVGGGPGAGVSPEPTCRSSPCPPRSKAREVILCSAQAKAEERTGHRRTEAGLGRELREGLQFVAGTRGSDT